MYTTIILLLAITASMFSATSAVLAILLYREVLDVDCWARIQTEHISIFSVSNENYDKIDDDGIIFVVSEEDNSRPPIALERRKSDEVK